MAPRIKGIALMALAIFAFSILDASAKQAMLSVPAQVAMFFRYTIAFLISVVVVLRVGDWQLLKTKHPLVQLLRGVMLLTSTYCNFTAMAHLQLAQTAAISFMIPLWVCALSGPLLGEQVGWRRWTAVLVAFMGVLIIMRPGTASFHWAMFFSLGATLAGAMYNILTRKVGAADRTETSLLYVCLVGAVGAALPLPWHWQMPQNGVWFFIIAMGLAGVIGHYLLIQGHRLAPASVLAPFAYTQIIWMILFGYILFGDVPDHWTLIGASVVIASGLFVFLRERHLGRQTTISIPAD